MAAVWGVICTPGRYRYSVREQDTWAAVAVRDASALGRAVAGTAQGSQWFAALGPRIGYGFVFATVLWLAVVLLASLSVGLFSFVFWFWFMKDYREDAQAADVYGGVPYVCRGRDRCCLGKVEANARQGWGVVASVAGAGGA